MSIFNDYSHQILHHQAEQEIIRQAEQNRLAREARGIESRRPWWWRLVHHEPTTTGAQRRPATGLAH
jgi:hypothetical protein